MLVCKRLINGFLAAGIASAMIVGLTPNKASAESVIYNKTIFTGVGPNQISDIDHSESSWISFTTQDGIWRMDGNNRGMQIEYSINKNDSYNGYAGASISTDDTVTITEETGVEFYYKTPETQTGTVALCLQGPVEKKIVELPATDGVFKYFYTDVDFKETSFDSIELYINGDEAGAVTEPSSGEIDIRFLEATNYIITEKCSISAVSTDTSKGTVTCQTPQADVHGSAIVNAEAKSGYKFMGWSLESADGKIVSTSPKFEFYVSSDTVLYAHFAEESTNECNLVTYDSYSKAPPIYKGNCRTYTANTQVTVSPSMPIGMVFECWYDENGSVVSTDKNYTFNITENKTLVVGYKYIPANFYSLDLYAGQGGRVQGSTESFPDQQSITIYAYPDEGYVFSGWYDESGNLVSNESTYTFNLTRNTTLYARFTKI